MIKLGTVFVFVFLFSACSNKPTEKIDSDSNYKNPYAITSILRLPVLDAVLEKNDLDSSCASLLRIKTYKRDAYMFSDSGEIVVNAKNISLRLGDKNQEYVLTVIKPENQFACDGKPRSFNAAEIIVPDKETLGQWKKILAPVERPNIVIPRLE